MALVSVLLATYFAAQTVNQGLFMDQLRPEGPFLNPNIYANYLVLNGFLAAYLVGTLQPDRPLAGTLLSLTMPLFAASLVVTASRGALFGAAVGVAAVPILYPGRDPRKLLQPIFVLPAVLSGTACCGPVVLIVLGIQASGVLLTAFQFLLPFAALLLVGSLVLVGRQVDPQRP
jgi:hypothetical protein